MHNNPGVIIVQLTANQQQVKQEIDDALSSGAELLFANNFIAVFSSGYKK